MARTDTTTRAHGRWPAIGCWVNLFEPSIGELLGRAGYDYAMLDMEHSPVTFERLLPMVRAVQLGGAKALVRAPDADPAWIGRLMDLGADGAMVPRVGSADEAATLARAAVYAPAGARGMAAGIVRASGWGLDADYVATARDRFLLLLQVETREAVAAAADIAATDGVDMVFIGPYDLAGSLGQCGEPDHPTTRSAIDEVVAAVRANGKPLATLPTPAVDADAWLRRGFDLVFSGSDVTMLRSAMTEDVSARRATQSGDVANRRA